MRKIFQILIGAFFFLYTGSAMAQRNIPGQIGIQGKIGSVDGFKPYDNGYRFSTSLALTRINVNRTSWLFGVNYLQKDYVYRGDIIPRSQFTGEVGYYVPLFADRGWNVCLSAGITGFAGYEIFGWGTKILYDGARLTYEDRFIFGGAIAGQLDVYLSDRVIFLLNLKQNVILRTTAENFHAQIGIGFKFIIN